MKKEKSVGGLSVKAVVFSAIVTFFALLCDPFCLSLNVVRKDKLLFNFFTLAAQDTTTLQKILQVILWG